ncbi:MAG: carbohydrate ABC transporter permease [Chloroflexi bacterium]|nr:carbohydrate ABC transporter permease [Chloroflexota bacterium]
MAHQPESQVRSTYRLQKTIGRILVYLLLFAGSALYLFPFIWMIQTSLKDLSQVYIWPPQWFPDPLKWSNYPEAWEALPWPQFYLNTIELAVLRIIGTVLSFTIAAYGFARLRFPGRDALFLVLLSTMMLPGQVTMIPLYIWFSKLDWIDTMKPLVVPSFLGSAFNIFLLRQFFMTIPHELDDAAKIDGCGYFKTFVSVVLPLAVPVIGVVTIFTFTGSWNDFMGPLIYLSGIENYTIAIGLQWFNQKIGANMPYLMAMGVAALLPQIVLFFFTQKRMIQGVTLTGMKQ